MAGEALATTAIGPSPWEADSRADSWTWGSPRQRRPQAPPNFADSGVGGRMDVLAASVRIARTARIDSAVCTDHAVCRLQESVLCPRPVQMRTRGERPAIATMGGPEQMARTGGSSGVRGRAATPTRRTARGAGGAGGDVTNAVMGLVRALPIAGLDKRLATLEKSVARLEAEIRKAVERISGAVRRGAPAGGAAGTTRRAGGTTRRAAPATRGTTTRRAAGTATRRSAGTTPRRAAGTTQSAAASTRSTTARRPAGTTTRAGAGSGGGTRGVAATSDRTPRGAGTRRAASADAAPKRTTTRRGTRRATSPLPAAPTAPEQTSAPTTE
jgi:hypothetical protein